MTFQTQVNARQAPAVEGDFAGSGLYANMLSPVEGGLVCGAAGVTVGKFAWATALGIVSNTIANPGAAQYGFVHREQQALITAFLGESSMLIQPGCPVTLMKEGSFWGRFAAGATWKQKVYFSFLDGSLSAAATASAATSTFTANTATDTSLVVTALAGSNVIALGQPVSGAGIPAGAYIIAGPAAGGVGTYTLSAATTATATGVTVTNTLTKETDFEVGQTVSAGELAKFSTWGL